MSSLVSSERREKKVKDLISLGCANYVIKLCLVKGWLKLKRGRSYVVSNIENLMAHRHDHISERAVRSGEYSPLLLDNKHQFCTRSHAVNIHLETDRVQYNWCQEWLQLQTHWG
jgi:hypothetical protein